MRNTTGSDYAYVYLYKNGSRFTTGFESGQWARQNNLAANSTMVTGTTVVNAAVGDYFQCYFQSSSAVTPQSSYIRFSISYQGA